jgi:DNA-binding NarL/FixJ family response regulator
MGSQLDVGSTFAGHRIDAMAGHGGMAVVYRATDLALGRCVALKLIAPSMAQDDEFRARFERECRLAATIHHPHAVEIFHAGEEDGLLYVTMRYVEGTDLRAILEHESPLEPARAVGLVGQVAGALDEAHRHGLVHRDVKPANILVARENGTEHAFLTDFGLSKTIAAAEEALTRTGFAMGTADYMSPEQAKGIEVDARADIYALGCVLFRALTGSMVFERDSDVEKMWAHVQDPPPWLLDLRPELPWALGEVLASALAKERSERPRSAGAFAREAVAALERPDDGASRERAPGAPLRVVVADDSVLLRAGVAGVLAEAGFDVVAQAGDADELLREVRAHRPDVAVVDVRMPPTHTDEGLQAARVIRAEFPGTGVLVLSQYVEVRYAVELLEESAEGVGYLLKDRVADGDSLANAVRQVGQGGSALDPEVVARMLDRRRPEGPLDRLSPREREVLGRMAEGQSNQAIAESLDLSERVVERHVSSIFSKLELPSGAAGHRRVLAVLTYLRA